MKTQHPEVSDREIRDAIMKVLYRQHRDARGRTGLYLGFKQLESKVKQLMSPKKLKRQDIQHNLDYLVQGGWIAEEEQKTYIKNLGKMGAKPVYKISAEGIRLMEPNATKFMPISSPYSGINIQAIGSVISIGSHNLLSNNPKIEAIIPKLDELDRLIKLSQELSETDKLNLINDLESLKYQTAKSEPDKDIIRKILNNIWGTFKNIGKGVIVEVAIKAIATHFGVSL
ncbi:MAG: hypothetical protein DRN95_08770 [Candidatus Hydrothermarchaeota archaeon]|nr:MAG: hypothetical protein DRN95_08770 [Candidatus Hydrothermarchaeota archaeon]